VAGSLPLQPETHSAPRCTMGHCTHGATVGHCTTVYRVSASWYTAQRTRSVAACVCGDVERIEIVQRREEHKPPRPWPAPRRWRASRVSSVGGAAAARAMAPKNARRKRSTAAPRGRRLGSNTLPVPRPGLDPAPPPVLALALIPALGSRPCLWLWHWPCFCTCPLPLGFSP